MGTVIKATAVSAEAAAVGSVGHAAIAAGDCLEQAGIGPEHVDMLINVGVYRDENIFEPAVSALVQKRIGMNLDYVRDPNPRAGFSFDLMNGACGMLNAVQVAGAFFETGSAERILVVSSDGHPSGQDVTGFPFAALGGAMLLERTAERDTGFGPVATVTAKDPAPGVRGYLGTASAGAYGRDSITVERDADYIPRLVDLAADLVRGYLADERIDPARTLLVSSRPSPGFAALVGDRTGFDPRAVVTADHVDKDPHSSALTLAYHRATVGDRERAVARPDHDAVLFLAAGSGLTAACAVYRHSR